MENAGRRLRHWQKLNRKNNARKGVLAWKLSLKLQIPTATLYRRIQKLKERQIIVGDFYQVDASKLEMETYEVLLSAKGASKKLRENLFAFSKAHDNIVHFVSCLGQWDHEIGVEVKSGLDLTAVLQELAEQFGTELVNIQTLSLLRNLKYSLYPFDFDPS